MKIGIPRAFLYYKYGLLWQTFFNELGIETINSSPTTKQTLENGKKYSIDESCLSSKIYMGHVYELIPHCDMILIPRINGFSKQQQACVKFNGLYDIIKNTFDINILDYNIDFETNNTEQKGFINMGKTLGFSRKESLNAYRKAKKIDNEIRTKNSYKQEELLSSPKKKILLVSHPYNSYDAIIGNQVTSLLDSVEIIYADKLKSQIARKYYSKLSKELYWFYSQELVGSVYYYQNKIDGIILLSTFPCGIDSLVNELLIKKIKNVPIINITIDELQSSTGLETRIESFLDIVKGVSYEENH